MWSFLCVLDCRYIEQNKKTVTFSHSEYIMFQKQLNVVYRHAYLLVCNKYINAYNSNKNVYPCKPQFYEYYIKVGCEGV